MADLDGDRRISARDVERTLSRMRDRIDRQQRQIAGIHTVLLVMALYLIAWLVGWGLGAW